jgi:hypothetical protein
MKRQLLPTQSGATLAIARAIFNRFRLAWGKRLRSTDVDGAMKQRSFEMTDLY